MKERRTGISLESMRASSEEQFREILFDFASKYSLYLNLDFSKDVRPHLDDKAWWEADYGQASRDGKSVGMSAKDALRCLVDIHRTYQLYRGISETVEGLKVSGKTEIIGIDAGTGTGILAIIMLSQGVDRVNAIEINKETIGVTGNFIKGLGLSDRVNLIEGDATRIDTPELRKTKADILVSENLSGGLLDEPQYDIIKHLSKYLSPEAEIIPGGAELYASVATVNWEGAPIEKNNIAARRLKECNIVSPRVKYSNVESEVGMSIPIIESNITLPTDFTGPINALLISTRFRINNLGESVYLEPDTADFLGKTFAFKLGSDVYAKGGFVKVSLKYETGRERKHLILPVDGNKIELIDTMLK